MTVQTKDAPHPYRPACLMATGVPEGVSATILEAVEYGRCPRCLGRLPSRPNGSVSTKCRCVPLCEDCIVEELQPETYLDPGEWPLPIEQRTNRRALKADVQAILEHMGREQEGHDRSREYRASDAALDALALIQAVKIGAEGQGGAETTRALWTSIPEGSRGIVATTLAGWVITMNSLTAVEFDTWATQVRNAALAMQERGQ